MFVLQAARKELADTSFIRSRTNTHAHTSPFFLGRDVLKIGLERWWRFFLKIQL